MGARLQAVVAAAAARVVRALRAAGIKSTLSTSFASKRVLITGGSSGIGLALAKGLAAEGAWITILGRRQQVLQQALEEIRTVQRGDCAPQAIAADVSDAPALERALAPYLQSGAPDLLINSAGITNPGLIEDLPLQLHRDNMDINYFGTLHAIRAVLPGMLARGSGTIVNFSSLVGMHGIYGYSAYSPSKFAVRALSDSLRYELQPRGVRVSVVFPSDTQTPQLDFDKANQPPVLRYLTGDNVKVSSADEVAAAVLRGVRRGDYLIVPSSDGKILFTIYRLLPGRALYWFVDRLMDRARRKAAKHLSRH